MISVPGLDVPDEALDLLLRLERDGFRCRVDQDRLTVSPKPDADTAAQIRRFKGPIVGMLAYRAEEQA